ncbi:MAG: GntR family transcriptional regulator [Candidatus Omnitrophica bacterium]|nr:GntR family transcriptional regulator [Candidatus Omnitrophota bacterium]
MEEIIERLKNGVEKGHPIPIYYQIEKKVEEMIEKKIILPGERIPGDIELSKSLNVSHITVRKAFSRLIEKGLIERIPGAGTFVKERKKESIPNIGFFYILEAEIIMLRRIEFTQRYLTKYNYDLKIIGYEKDFFEKVDIYEEVHRKNLKGAIIQPIITDWCKEALIKLEEKNFPHVRIGSGIFIDELKAPLVRGDDYQRIRDALNYLWKYGHRSIGIIVNYKNSETEKGYYNFYLEKGKKPERKWCMSVEFSGPPDKWEKLPGAQIARGYLDQNPDITALIVEHPSVCIDFLKQAILMGKKVPECLSIMCLSDWEGMDATFPAITSMYLSDKEMSESACDLLFDVIKNGFQKKIIKKIKYKLIERESVTAPSINSENLIKK